MREDHGRGGRDRPVRSAGGRGLRGAVPGTAVGTALWTALWTASLAAGSPAPTAAQEPARPDTIRPDSVAYEVEAIRVRATRPLVTTGGASAVRLSLASPRVEPSPLLEEALRAMPFVQVRENSRGEAQLTLRGTESRQVAVLVDGVPLTLGWDARTDLSLIPIQAAHQIQLFRGLSSVLHGPNVLGGVVDVDISGGDVPPDPPESGFELGVDETGAAIGGARVGGRFDAGGGSLWVQGGAGVRSRDGVPLPGGVGQPVTVDEGRRLNSDLDHVSGFLAGRYDAESGAWASLSSFAFRAEKGVPPELHVEDPRLWRIPETARLVTALSAGTAWGRTPLGEGDLEASVGLDVGDSEIAAYETLAYEAVEEREFSDDRTLTLRLVGDHTLGGGMLRGAFTWAETRHDERIVPDPGASARYRQRLMSLGLEVEHPIAERIGSGDPFSDLQLTVGGSLDRAATPETGGKEARDPITEWGARIGGSALIAGGGARLHVGASRRVRFPSLRELYSGALGRFVPNPDLAAEKLRTLEAGVTGRFDAAGGEVEGQALLFHQRLSDAVVRTGLGDGRFQRQNRNRVRAAGLELLGTLGWGEVALGGELTWQDVNLTDEAAPEERRRAEYQPEIFGGVDLSGPLPGGLTGRAAVEVVGRQFCVDPELGSDLALDRTGRLDFLLSRDFDLDGPLRRIQATVAMDNVTDAAVFDQCGLPQPGRLLRLQLRLR